jgi:hypothetical protein
MIGDDRHRPRLGSFKPSMDPFCQLLILIQECRVIACRTIEERKILSEAPCSFDFDGKICGPCQVAVSRTSGARARMAEGDEFRGAPGQEHRQSVIHNVGIVGAIRIELDGAMRPVWPIDRHAKDGAELQNMMDENMSSFMDGMEMPSGEGERRPRCPKFGFEISDR